MSSFFRETARLTVRYAVVALAAVPAGIVYGVTQPTRAPFVVSLFAIGLCFAAMAWQISARWMEPPPELITFTSSAILMPYFSPAVSASQSFALSGELLYTATPDASQVAANTAITAFSIDPKRSSAAGDADLVELLVAS
jgi:hypothetical protein